MSQLEPELRNFYYLAVITLFKPHRQTTLLANNQSPVAAYREFVTNGDSVTVAKMRTFENQWQDYYHAQRSNDDDEESAEARILRIHAPATKASVLEAMGATSVSQDDDLEIPDDFTDITATTTPDSSTQKLSDDAKKIIRDVENLENVIVGVERCYRSYENDVSIEPDFEVEGYTSRIISSTPGADQNECLGTHNFIIRFREARTRLEILRECFAPVTFREVATPQWSPSTLPDFPQIAMVSEAYQLNFWQHVIFEVAARHLLYSYSQDIEDALCEPLLPAELRSCSPYDIKKQLIGYLGGETGTGKSTVVDALLTFANNWGRSGSVETLAFTGVAAINIKGRTMHSARNLKLNGAEPNASSTVEMKSRFNGVVLVIIDEISITDQGLLGGTNAVSRSMSLSPDKFMGGKHTLLIGDLLQLPPVAGSPCFQSPSPQASRQRQAGYALYSAINVVVFLTKNMRARFDAEYTKILDDLRWGRISDAQLEKLNTRAQTTNVHEEPTLFEHTETSYRPIVVCTNKLRCAINNELIFHTASARQLPIYECLAQPSARSRLIVEHLWNVNDNLTDRIPMKLLFFIGMPVMITHKHPDLLEADIIANGVIGTLVGTYPPLEQLPEIMYEVSGIVVHKFIRLPTLLLIKLHGVQTTLVHGFPDGVIGLPLLKGSVHLGKIPNLSQSSVIITQFALVPAFACTTEKLQGQTCYDGIVVTPLDRRRGVPCQTLYVALSRAVSLDGLTLTEPITRTYLEQFKPTEAIACEMQRLINVVRPPPYISPQETLSFEAWKATQHI